MYFAEWHPVNAFVVDSIFVDIPDYMTFTGRFYVDGFSIVYNDITRADAFKYLRDNITSFIKNNNITNDLILQKARKDWLSIKL